MHVEVELGGCGDPTALHLEHDAAVGIELLAVAFAGVVVQGDHPPVLALADRGQISPERALGLAVVTPELGQYRVFAAGRAGNAASAGCGPRRVICEESAQGVDVGLFEGPVAPPDQSVSLKQL